MSYDPTEALEKYEDKMYFLRLRWDRMSKSGLRMRETIDKAHEHAAESFAPWKYVQKMIRPILQKHKMATELWIGYFAYGQALYKSQRIMEYMVDWKREHDILRNRFESRGLNPGILDEIDGLLIIHKATG